MPKTILVAEDDEANYYLLHEWLVELGYQVKRAANGIEAVDICKSAPEIDLVLMDIKLPRMNGLEATRLIKQFKPHMPIVAQTAFALHDEQYIAIQSGCDDYLSKPINYKSFLVMLDEHIGPPN
jgi:CheY-like chemotaxis protein